MTTLGIDPGARWTGLAVRDGRDLLHHQLLQRPDGATMDDWLDANHHHIHAVLGQHDASVAIEGIVHPTPHMGLTNVGALLDTAQVLGMVRSHWDCVVVRPDRHGRVPKALLDIKGPGGLKACRTYLLANFPQELVPARVSRGESDDLRHVRAAWDVAGRGKSAQQRFGVSA